MNCSGKFRILAVCTGNVCRSPMVERLLQVGLDDLQPGLFVVRSAGTQSLVGHTMTPQIAGLTRVLGADVEGFKSQQLTAELVQRHDLVLALTRKHRSYALGLVPQMLKKVFTLREFGRLVTELTASDCGKWANDPVDRWRNLVSVAPQVRFQCQPGLPEQDDVTDPFGESYEVHKTMVAEIVPAVRALIGFESAFASTSLLAQDFADTPK